MHRALTRTLAGACALALLFSACGDDGGDDEADDTTTTTEVATDPTTTAATDDDPTSPVPDDDGPTTTAATGGGDEAMDPDAVALAEAINLTIDDFDASWSAEPAEDDGDDDGSINDCFVETAIREVALGRAESDTFSIELSETQAQLVTMQTLVFDSAGTAEAVTAEAAGDAFLTCTTEALVSSFGPEADGDLELQVDGPPLTDESLGLVGGARIPTADGAVQALIDVHLFRTENVVSFVATVDLGDTGFFEDTIGDLYGAVAARHDANVG